MSMRVTHRTMQAATLSNLQASLTRSGRLQEQLSSGRLISRPSDDPAGTVTALQLRADVRRTEQHQRNADNGIGWLGSADSALTQSLSVVRKVKELALQGSSTGSTDTRARAALATAVEGLRETLLGLANTSYAGRPVFGGTTSGQAAYALDASTGAITYAGDGGAVRRRVGDGDPARVDVSGPETFGADGDSVFDLLTRVAADLVGDPAALSGDLAELDAATNRILTAVTSVGTRYGRLEGIQQSAADRLIDLESSLATVESVDLPATIVEMQMQEVAYQAALGATARVLQPTLLDFLR
jgi:flagellar hook-associated protein 3 FlgL